MDGLFSAYLIATSAWLVVVAVMAWVIMRLRSENAALIAENEALIAEVHGQCLALQRLQVGEQEHLKLVSSLEARDGQRLWEIGALERQVVGLSDKLEAVTRPGGAVGMKGVRPAKSVGPEKKKKTVSAVSK